MTTQKLNSNTIDKKLTLTQKLILTAISQYGGLEAEISGLIFLDINTIRKQIALLPPNLLLREKNTYKITNPELLDYLQSINLIEEIKIINQEFSEELLVEIEEVIDNKFSYFEKINPQLKNSILQSFKKCLKDTIQHQDNVEFVQSIEIETVFDEIEKPLPSSIYYERKNINYEGLQLKIEYYPNEDLLTLFLRQKLFFKEENILFLKPMSERGSPKDVRMRCSDG